MLSQIMPSLALGLLAASAPQVTGSGGPPPGDAARLGAERRVVEYLKAHVRPGEPVIVSDLYNRVFTTSEERAVLDRLFNAFFKLPLAIAQQQQATGRPPTLAELSEQLRFTVPGEAEVMLRIMESDPRMPRFLERDARTGEITRVDVSAILAHPRFGRALERTIGGWEGRPAPAFSITSFDGRPLTLESGTGRPRLLYFWFTGCPPCVRTSPLLARLHEQFGPRGLDILAVNADRVLGLPISEADRAASAAKTGSVTTLADANAEIVEAYGAVTVFPTFFFLDRRGVVVRQLVGYQEAAVLEDASRRAVQ